MKSNWIHCRAFGFSEQTHHFLKSGRLCHPGLRGSWLCLVPITCLPGWVGLVLWLCWGSAGRVCLAFCGWSDFLRSPVYIWFPNKAAPHFLPLIKKLVSPFHSITSPTLQSSSCPMSHLPQTKTSLSMVQILTSVAHFSCEQR